MSANSKITKTDGGYLLSVSSPKFITEEEFWLISREANNTDTRNEVEEYLKLFPKKYKARDIQRLVDKVVETRISNENGDQIYGAMKELKLL